MADTRPAGVHECGTGGFDGKVADIWSDTPFVGIVLVVVLVLVLEIERPKMASKTS
jgi:hypothetical protein